MKNLIKIILLCTFFAAFGASASSNIRNIELLDSSVIDGEEISAVMVDENLSIDALEMSDGSLIDSALIKKIHLKNEKNQKLSPMMKISRGGEGSGG